MTQQEAQKLILNLYTFAQNQSAGYATWGKVDILQVAIKLNDKEYVFNKEHTDLKSLKTSDIELSSDKKSLFGKLFAQRPKIGVILLTKQTYAAQVKEEIPPILDDQAQLLGVSVKVAKDASRISDALCGRYAALLPNGTSVCIGTNIDEAYVAAQLLEKTSKAFVEAKVLGGAKSINRIEAWLMHQFYQLKYSKEASKNK